MQSAWGGKKLFRFLLRTFLSQRLFHQPATTIAHLPISHLPRLSPQVAPVLSGTSRGNSSEFSPKTSGRKSF
jgi:hypothetical protein